MLAGVTTSPSSWMTAISPTSSVARDVTPSDAVRRDAPARWRQRTSPSMPRGSPCTTLPLFFERDGETASPVTAVAALDAGHGFCAAVGGGAGGSVFSSSSLQAIAAHPATRTTAHHVRRGRRISTAVILPGLVTTRIREEGNSVGHCEPTHNRNLAHVHLHRGRTGDWRARSSPRAQSRLSRREAPRRSLVIHGATPNFQFPTTNHSQLPTANNAQRTPKQIEVGNWKSGVVGNWELEVGSGWELGVGSWEFSQFVRRG